jgi:CheY-like chemotaxis protein
MLLVEVGGLLVGVSVLAHCVSDSRGQRGGVVKECCILYVEDNEDDVTLLGEALKRAGGGHRLRIAKSGQEAMDYLSGQGGFGDRKRHPRPSLMVLEWEVAGLYMLKWVRKQPRFAGLKVVVFTYSHWEEDFRAAQQAGADGYFCKPCQFSATERFARTIVSMLAGGGEEKRGAAGGFATSDETLTAVARFKAGDRARDGQFEI